MIYANTKLCQFCYKQLAAQDKCDSRDCREQEVRRWTREYVYGTEYEPWKKLHSADAA